MSIEVANAYDLKTYFLYIEETDDNGTFMDTILYSKPPLPIERVEVQQ